MAEKEPEQLAQEFIDLQLKALIVPLDDQNLGAEGYQSRQLNRLSSRSCLKFMEQMENLLECAHISTYFRRHLIYELSLEYGDGYTTKEPIIDGSKKYYGIYLPEKRYGFFQSVDTGFKVETTYFYKQAVDYLRMMEQAGIYRPVDWRQWGDYLLGQLASRN
ncbi:MAG: hypothetical protein M1142_01155 [Patescibacteria group bacterium]|nr:hypothetical protein [Patescibacteria group bacterium]